MINFRFHVVSIIAVFLAIAIGTVLGSAFVGRGVVDRLQNQIDRVQKNADEANSENERLKSDAGATARYIDQTAAYAVGRSLPGVTVAVVSERGLEGGVLDAQATLARDAGAAVPGVVWLEERWSLSRAEDLTALRAATGLTTRAPAALRTQAAALLGQRLAAGAPATGDDVLTNLANADFVTLSGVAGSPAPTAADFVAGARGLVLGGPQSPLPDGVEPALAGGMLDGAAKVVVGEAFVATEEVTDRATWIDSIADADALRNRLSTVDDVEGTAGQVASVLALAELGAGGHGNYGLGRDPTVPAKVVTVPSTK